MSMGRAFEKVLPMADGLRGHLADLKVSDPALAAAHGAMLAACDEHASNLRALSEDMSSNTFSDTKERLKESVAAFAEALEAWVEATGG